MSQHDNILFDNSTRCWHLWHARDHYVCDTRRAPLGRGGMGEVWLGTNVRTGAPVAVKRIHDRYANIPDIRKRARLEADLAFRHDHLVEMIGYVESVTGRGPIFIISKFVSGMNIDRFIAANFSTYSDDKRQRHIVEMLYPVLEALDYIHGYNIVHLDIKPSNIMVEAGKNIRLMDMGISFVAGSQNRRQHDAIGEGTSASSLQGTPKYAAPEQFGEEHGFGSITAATDIYEFGVTLYELITGFNPFLGKSIDETLNLHIRVELPAAQGLSRPVLEVLRKATATRQSDRYNNVRELRKALEDALNYKPTIWEKLRDKVTNKHK